MVKSGSNYAQLSRDYRQQPAINDITASRQCDATAELIDRMNKLARHEQTLCCHVFKRPSENSSYAQRVTIMMPNLETTTCSSFTRTGNRRYRRAMSGCRDSSPCRPLPRID